MAKKTELKARSLTPEDLERVIEIDAELVGRSRRGFFENRLAASLRSPEEFAVVGVDENGALAGYAIARIHEGDFGQTEATAALDAIGVFRGAQSKGLGQALIAGLDERLRKRGVTQLHTQIDWRFHSLANFFDSAGFSLAPVQVLECDVAAQL